MAGMTMTLANFDCYKTAENSQQQQQEQQQQLFCYLIQYITIYCGFSKCWFKKTHTQKKRTEDNGLLKMIRLAVCVYFLLFILFVYIYVNSTKYLTDTVFSSCLVSQGAKVIVLDINGK